jgi:hypothetical protein
MAKKKATEWGAKAKMARELIGQGKGNTEIVDLMKEQGVSVHPNYVSSLRAKAGGGKRRRRRRRKGQAEAAPSSSAPAAAGNGLRTAINFCKSVGGIKEAEKLIATLREIKGL